MARGKDSAGHRYEEFDMSDNEQVRVTYIPHQDWAKGPTLRIQKRAFDGRVVRGPEFPAAKADDLIRAIRDVLTE
ncbi:MAG: hypothetical protein C0498_11060 [Anaerolinea sp.]|jgi:hypothetical protein|nr:hypothetical protein [Anaerolinea sp.]